jgi:hypothetical protein
MQTYVSPVMDRYMNQVLGIPSGAMLGAEAGIVASDATVLSSHSTALAANAGGVVRRNMKHFSLFSFGRQALLMRRTIDVI